MKRILLIDHNDPRRATRVFLLQRAGYEVVTAERFEAVEGHGREAAFDLIVLETEDIQQAVIAYGNRLRAMNPKLPILLLSDMGLFLPKDSLLAHFATANPTAEVMTKVAALLLESTHEREDSTRI